MTPAELSSSRARCAAIPGAADAEIETGHLGPVEQPDLVATTIRRFPDRGQRAASLRPQAADSRR
jgi:hypothetical protein